MWVGVSGWVVGGWVCVHTFVPMCVSVCHYLQVPESGEEGANSVQARASW